MSILGIVAEYDPFHRGHESHLQAARAAVGPSAVYVALSPCFRQRGELAFLSPYSRARCALISGADAVFALPVAHVLCDGERYAFHAVSLLQALGCTHLAFGAESANLSSLQQAANLMDDPTPAMRRVLRARLEEGMGFPEARDQALRAECPEAGDLLSLPNNILAVSYLRAIRKCGSILKPIPIPRRGNDHADFVDPESPSASAVRAALLRGDWASALPSLPPCSREEVQIAFLRHCIPDTAILDHLLLSCLRAMTVEQAGLLPDLSEGLENRLLQAAGLANTRAGLLSLVVSRRYSRARISRLCAAALLGLHREDLPASPPPEVLLLGLRRKQAFTASWRDLPLRILSTLRESENPSLWKTDLAAWKIWAQCASLPDTLPFSEKMVTL